MSPFRTAANQETLRLALQAAEVDAYVLDRHEVGALLETVHPGDRPRVAAAVERAMEGPEPLRIEYRTVGPSGVRWVSDRARSVAAREGVPAHLVGVRADVTRRHEAEDAARLGEHRLQLALEAGRLGSWEFDFRSGILNASAQCKANHGLAPDADLRLEENVIAAVDADQQAAFRAALERAIETRGVFDVEVPNTWPDGSHHWLQIRGRVVDEHTLVGVTLDVTARRAAEEALRDADRQKDQFLTVLAHELRGPIAPIVNAAHILQAVGPPDERLVKQRETILRQAKQLAGLVEDLMDVGRIREGKLRVDRRRVELNAILRHAAETCAPAIERRRHALHVRPAGRPIYVEADERRLVQIFCNLLSNAAKYMREGGRIDLEAGEERGAAVVAVQDAGVGIPREMLASIFQRYVQVGSSEHRADGGLGIGLALVKALVEEHGGSVSVQSEGIGRGSRFEVRLPTAAPLPGH